MAKVIQFSTTRMGDNINAEEVMITTVLYDDGSMYEGSMQTVGGNFHDGFQKEMVWTMISLPNRQPTKQ